MNELTNLDVRIPLFSPQTTKTPGFIKIDHTSPVLAHSFKLPGNISLGTIKKSIKLQPFGQHMKCCSEMGKKVVHPTCTPIPLGNYLLSIKSQKQNSGRLLQSRVFSLKKALQHEKDRF